LEILLSSGEGWTAYFCICPKPRTGFPTSYDMVFFYTIAGSMNNNINMESTIAGSMNNNTNIDSTIAGSMNNNINMDSTIAWSMNDNINMDSTIDVVIHYPCYCTVYVYVVIH
jgi:hypothetical protein